MTVKEIVDVCSALLTPLIAIIATYIAYQQYNVSELTLIGLTHRVDVARALPAPHPLDAQ